MFPQIVGSSKLKTYSQVTTLFFTAKELPLNFRALASQIGRDFIPYLQLASEHIHSLRQDNQVPGLLAQQVLAAAMAIPANTANTARMAWVRKG